MVPHGGRRSEISQGARGCALAHGSRGGAFLASSSVWWLWLHHSDPSIGTWSSALCLSFLLFLQGPYWVRATSLRDLILTDDVCKDPVSKWRQVLRIPVDGSFGGTLFRPVQAVHLVLTPGSSTTGEDRRGCGSHQQSPQRPECSHVWGQLGNSVPTKQGHCLSVTSLTFLQSPPRFSPSSLVGDS